MKYVIINHNLLGDALFSEPAIASLRKSICSEDEIIMVVSSDQHNLVFENNPNFKLMVVTEDQMKAFKEKYTGGVRGLGTGQLVNYSATTKACVLDVSAAFNWCYNHQTLKSFPVSNIKKPDGTRVMVDGAPRVLRVPQHFAFAFAHQLGVTIDNPHCKVYLTPEEIEDGKVYLSKRYKKPVILCGAVSKSCISRSTKPGEENLPPNKMLTVNQWTPVIEAYKDRFDFVFLSGPDESLLDTTEGRYPENVTWQCGVNIRRVAAMCKAAVCIVGIDSGVGHLAAAVDANLISIFAAVHSQLVDTSHTSGKFIVIDHSQGQLKNSLGISTVTSGEIIEAIEKMIG